jgi:PTH1 family peptidyl-tRNA hydrolase
VSSRLILCCLGNPGPRYARTRHNLGFELGDALVDRAGASWSRPRDEFHWCRIEVRGREVTVVKPQTYMNLSGEALEVLSELEPVRAVGTLVVCDDIALPHGIIRLRKRGSDGGHNGLRSVIASLGTTRFPRLRLGVGPVPDGADASDYVLEALGEEGMARYAKMIREGVKCVETVLEHGIDVAMNRFNRRAAAPEAEE